MPRSMLVSRLPQSLLARTCYTSYAPTRVLWPCPPLSYSYSLCSCSPHYTFSILYSLRPHSSSPSHRQPWPCPVCWPCPVYFFSLPWTLPDALAAVFSLCPPSLPLSRTTELSCGHFIQFGLKPVTTRNRGSLTQTREVLQLQNSPRLGQIR